MKRLLLFVIAGVLITSCTGCSTMFHLKFNGESWSVGIGGDVPKVPLMDYQKNIK